jgi:hypothetical protein
MAATAKKYQSTTIRMPAGDYERVRQVVETRHDVGSLNEFVVDAVKAKLRELREREIDESIAAIAVDPAYLRESEIIEHQFRTSDVAASLVEEENEHRTDRASTTHAR